MKSRFYSLRLAGALALSLPALFEPGPANAEESKLDANAQYRKAFEALAQKNWPEARRQLLPLWNKSHTWDVAAGLGQAEFLLKNYAAGATYTAFALANVPPKEKTKTVERLRAALDEMKEAVGSVRIAVDKDGAEILAGHSVVGTSPLAGEIYLDPGTRLLEAWLPNAGRAERMLEVEAGKSYQVTLVVDSSRAEQPLASSGAASSGASPGLPQHPDGKRANWTPVFITGGLAIVAAAIGTGFAIDASSAKSDGEKALGNAQAEFGSNPCTPSKGGASELCQNVNELEDRRKNSHTVATGSFIVAGVFAGAAIGSYFLWAKPSSPRLDAWLGAEGGGLRLNGSF